MVKKAKIDLLGEGLAQEKAELLESIKQKDYELESLAGRLESSAELTRMIVHDLKGPLASIMANLDLLLSPRLGRVKREILETAIQGGNDLLNIINTLLEIGKMERGKLELNLSIINLAGMFKVTIGKMKSLAAQKNLTLKMDCRSKVHTFAADASLIERIICNLVMNAIKYTRNGGTITLMTQDGINEDEVILTVSDTGIGIPQIFHKTIFELYTQLCLPGERNSMKQDDAKADVSKTAAGDCRERRRMTNVGIGLAFCKLAAEQHGGRIWVDSGVGKGSTFFVALPTDMIPSGSGLI